MQIYVCVKHVPDSAANIHVIDDIRIDPNLAFLLNPYDEHAVTEAVKIKEQHPEAEVIAVCLGPEDAENTVRSALAMGADRGILVQTDSIFDSIETARILHQTITDDGVPGMIWTGKESIDAEGMQTMFRIGALLDCPVATNVVQVALGDNKAVVDSERVGGVVYAYELDLPCVLGAGRGLNTPKYPTFPDVVKSKKKPVKTVSLDAGASSPDGASMKVVKLEPLIQTRTPKAMTGDPDTIAREIVTILLQEAKVIS